MTLSDAQKRHLRGLAHALKPVVIVGQQGLHESVVLEIDSALTAHELIKVRVGAEDRDSRVQLINDISTQCSADVIQRIGHIAVLFRRNTKKPKVVIPSK